jgi:ABC-2 type transport system ATP-binding protein
MSTLNIELPPIGEPVLTLQSVSKSYGSVHAVADVSLVIPRGAIYGFLGPNGAGKTTIIRCIMNILLPDEGTIQFANQPLTLALRDRVGYLPEERGLYRRMKSIDQLAYLAELKGIPRREAYRRADVWLERLELADWRDKKVDTLSKGMQQKIQFAATFIHEPDLVILDEVFSGLDPLNIELIRELILASRDRGTTIIFSTHMLAEAEKVCDSIFLIEDGCKILDGTLDEVRAQFPLRSVRCAYTDGSEPPADLPGIIHREFAEGEWRLTLEETADTPAVLERLTDAGPLSLYSANRPSLNEIFLTAVRQRRAARDEMSTGATASGGEVTG